MKFAEIKLHFSGSKSVKIVNLRIVLLKSYNPMNRALFAVGSISRQNLISWCIVVLPLIPTKYRNLGYQFIWYRKLICQSVRL